MRKTTLSKAFLLTIGLIVGVFSSRAEATTTKTILASVETILDELPVITAPTALNATDTTANSFTAAWQEVGDADTYILDVYTKNEGNNESINGYPKENITRTSHEVTGLTAASEYYYAVKAVVTVDETPITSAVSEEIKVTTKEEEKPTPTLIVSIEEIPTMTAVVNETDSITLTVEGARLTGDVTLTITENYADFFAVDSATLITVNGVVNQEIKVTYKPAVAGDHTATLTIASEGAETVTRTLNGTATAKVNLPEYGADLYIYSNNGHVYFTTAGGLDVEIWNPAGQSIYKGTSVEGLNSIRVVDGMLIVKVGVAASKVLVK